MNKEEIIQFALTNKILFSNISVDDDIIYHIDKEATQNFGNSEYDNILINMDKYATESRYLFRYLGIETSYRSFDEKSLYDLSGFINRLHETIHEQHIDKVIEIIIRVLKIIDNNISVATIRSMFLMLIGTNMSDSSIIEISLSMIDQMKGAMVYHERSYFLAIAVEFNNLNLYNAIFTVLDGNEDVTVFYDTVELINPSLNEKLFTTEYTPILQDMVDRLCDPRITDMIIDKQRGTVLGLISKLILAKRYELVTVLYCEYKQYAPIKKMLTTTYFNLFLNCDLDQIENINELTGYSLKKMDSKVKKRITSNHYQILGDLLSKGKIEHAKRLIDSELLKVVSPASFFIDDYRIERSLGITKFELYNVYKLAIYLSDPLLEFKESENLFMMESVDRQITEYSVLKAEFK